MHPPAPSPGSLPNPNSRTSSSIRRVRLLAIYTLTTALYLALPLRADMITNGNFSQTNPSSPTDGFQLADGNNISLTDWDFEGTIGCLVPPGVTDTCGPHFISLYTPWFSPPDNSNFVAMDADPIITPASLSQTISGLVSGELYTLSFMQAAAQFQPYNGATTEWFQVTFGSQTQTTPVLDNPNNGFTNWVQQTMTFQATSTSQVLTFLAGGTPMGEPPTDLLADVSLTPTGAPEPSTYALVLLAIVAAGVILKWRKARS